MEYYTVYQGTDGRWRARFAPKIAARLGMMANSIVNAVSEETARHIAGLLLRDSLYNRCKSSPPHSVAAEPPEPEPSLF